MRRVLVLGLILTACRHTPAPAASDLLEIPPPPETQAQALVDPDPPTAGPTFVMQMGHSWPIYTIGLSPDGKTVASADGPGSLKIWSADTARVLATLRPYPGKAPSDRVAFTADGGRLAIPWDSVVDLREAKTGALVQRIDASPGARIALSPDGSMIAIGSVQRTLGLYDTATGRLLAPLGAFTMWPFALAFSPDGTKLAVGEYGSNPAIRLFDVARRAEIAVLTGHADVVKSIAFSPDGTRLVSSSHDKTVRVWSLATKASLQTLPGGILGTTVFWRPDAIVSVGLETQLFDPTTYAARAKLAVGGGQVAMSADGTRLALGDDSGRVQVASLPSGAVVSELPKYTSSVQPVAVSPDGALIAAGSDDGVVRLWDVATGHVRQALKGSGPRYRVVFSPDGALVAASGYFDDTAIWRVATGERVVTLKPSSTANLAFGADGATLATSTFWDSTLTVWDVKSGKAQSSMKGDKDARFGGVGYAPDGRLVVASGSRVSIWDPKTGAVRDLGAKMADLREVRPDGTLVDTTGKVFSLADGSVVSPELSDLHAPIAGLAFSKAGAIAVATGDSNVRVLDASRVVRATHRVRGSLGQVAFSPDGAFLVLGGDHLRVLRLSDGRVLSLEALEVKGRAVQLAHTEDGLFAGDDEAFERVRFRVGKDLPTAELLSAGQMFERFHRPTLVPDFFAGRGLDAAPVVQDLGPAPLVAFAEPIPAKVATERLAIRVSATDRGGGVDEVRVFVNGARADEGRGLKRLGTVVVVEALLTPGENVITAEAYSARGRVRSEPARAVVVLEAPSIERPVLYVLAMTLDEYDDPAMKLAYANADGEAVVEAFVRQKKSLYKDVVVRRLKDKAATKDALAAAANELAAKAKPSDVLLFYAAGHGTTLRCAGDQVTRYQLLTYRASLRSEDTVCKESLSDAALAELLRKVPARKKLVVLDTCEAGAAATGEMLVAMRGAEEIDTLKRLARAEGLAVVAAAKAAEYAGEVPALKHGLFSYALLQGLAGAARTGEKEPVTVFNLLAFLQSKVPSLSQEHFRRSQYPITSAQGQDFPIALP